MKRDAREIAHLIKAFKGGAEYLWCNFDQVQLSAIYAECAAIDKEIYRDTNAQNNTISSANGVITANFSNLEDSPCSQEQLEAFEKILAETQKKTKKNAKLKT